MKSYLKSGVSLPSEIWEGILRKLDFISIVKCMRICKEVRESIEDSPLINYIIELGVAGYIDNPNYTASPAHRILALSERVQYWKEMTWTKQVSSQTLGVSIASDMKISRGIFSSLTLPALGMKKVYELKHLKPRLSDPDQSPTTFDLPIGQMVLALDPGQDLLVIVVRSQNDTWLHFNKLGTLSPHPEASEPAVKLPAKQGLWARESQILESLLAITYRWSVSRDTIVNEVYNWRTGKSVFKLWTNSHLASSFKLISTARYIIIARQNPKVQLGGYALEVRMLPSASSSATSPSGTLIASFCLPALASPKQIGMALCRVEVTSKLTSDSFSPYNQPFISPPYPKLLLFHFMLVGGPESVAFHMAILSTCFFPTPEQLAPFPDRIIPWSDWGPSNTRCFLNKSIGVSVHMYRICTQDSIMDFNPVDIARDLCLDNKEDIWDQATIIPKSAGIFKEEVISSLPFRLVKHRINMGPFNYPTIRLGDVLVVTEGEKAVHSYL